ncbi:MAG: Mrp/NBP35 family ATP-binding protein [Hydrogenobaculum sp.]|nr:MAG: chromosome partitioning protein [Hydrogenobaculum sp.]
MAVKEILEKIKTLDLKDLNIQEPASIVKDLKVTGDVINLKLAVPEPVKEQVKNRFESLIKETNQNLKPNIEFVEGEPKKNPFEQPVFSKRSIKGVKRIIPVASGKGGVGKSTVATNLAMALSKLGRSVGLLDADIYGPSVPTMLGTKGARLTANVFNKIIPIEKYGVKMISMGFLLPSEDTPVIWRGPILMQALNQFLFDVDWGPLDYLILDLPPGTGDVQLSLAQNTAIDGAVVVTTPQDVALVDVKKAVSMFREVNIPILGVVENMAYFVCPETGKEYRIFGESKVPQFVQTYNLKLLGSIPIEPDVTKYADEGMPIVEASPESRTAKAFMGIAKIVDSIYQGGK